MAVSKDEIADALWPKDKQEEINVDENIQTHKSNIKTILEDLTPFTIEKLQSGPYRMILKGHQIGS